MPRRKSKLDRKIKKQSKVSRRSTKKTKTRRRSRKLLKSALGLGALGTLGALGLGMKYYYDKQFIIEVMPDVEGCWNKVISFMSKSSIFTVNGKSITYENFAPENYKQIRMRSNCKFVCLGDTIDNGPNNFAFIKIPERKIWKSSNFYNRK